MQKIPTRTLLSDDIQLVAFEDLHQSHLWTSNSAVSSQPHSVGLA